MLPEHVPAESTGAPTRDAIDAAPQAGGLLGGDLDGVLSVCVPDQADSPRSGVTAGLPLRDAPAQRGPGGPETAREPAMAAGAESPAKG